jgi:S-adenosylmethionine:tRNA ribosyltransferase-isomerase
MSKPVLFPHDLLISDFGYDLPDEKIARYPLEKRDSSKLLIWKSGELDEGLYSGIGNYLPNPSLLVFNNSRVIEARILFQKPSGGQIEIFCLEPYPTDINIAQAMVQTGKALWTCLIGGASKWKHGKSLMKQIGETSLEVRFIEKRTDYFIVEFSWTPHELSFASLLHQFGSIPLPPYLKRPAEISDAERYQTVYARESGSVAAPTAGLHFSVPLIQSLAARGIESTYLTLHVGAGTFMPVKSIKLSDHNMHEEFIEVCASTIEILISKLQNPVIAVGTTSVRTIETLYWLGLQISRKKNIKAKELQLVQAYPYTTTPSISPGESLNYLLEWIRKEPEQRLITKTQLFIVPGYSFQIARGLVTNFHQPHSTLLMLVAALIGPGWKSVYAWALKNDYRFLSYGDGCLFLPDSIFDSV